MEHFELVEKLVNTFGVSYEEAKNALESSNWDAIEAAVLIERKKNGAKVEEKAEEPKRKFCFDGRGKTEKGETPQFLKDIWSFFSDNAVMIKKNSGEIFLDIPLWLAILLVCSFFWAMVIVMCVLFVMGYRISFRGPHLGRKNVKGAVEKAEDAVEDVVEKVKETIAESEPVNEAPAEIKVEVKQESESSSILENAEVKVKEPVSEEKPQEPSEPQA